jgi:protocatechuate 3,4-dioxygenase beta subunit
MRASAIAAALALLAAATAHGQQRPIALRGVIFDSLRGQPIRNASVSIAGRSDVMTTDASGRFQFDSVEPGVHRIVAQHPIFDSIGLSGLATRASVADGIGEVRLATPSFATLWRLSCRGAAPKDSGIVYGTIRDLHGNPVANAEVKLSWSDLGIDDHRRLRQRLWQIETRSNAEGGYAACGVPPDLGLALHARSADQETGTIGLPSLTTRIQRHDLVVGAASRESNGETATVSGIVTDPSGAPVGDARVMVDSLPEIRTRDDGTFNIAGVPSGTRSVQVRAFGAVPVSLAVDAIPGAVANLAVTVRQPMMLAPVETRAERNVRVLKAEFNERRRLGLGYLRDSTEIVKYDRFLNVFRDVPSVDVQFRKTTLQITVPDPSGGRCAPRVMIDGAEAQFGHLIDLESKEVAALEVYVRVSQIPARYAPIGIQHQCGIILVWTKYGMRNR